MPQRTQRTQKLEEPRRGKGTKKCLLKISRRGAETQRFLFLFLSASAPRRENSSHGRATEPHPSRRPPRPIGCRGRGRYRNRDRSSPSLPAPPAGALRSCAACPGLIAPAARGRPHAGACGSGAARGDARATAAESSAGSNFRLFPRKPLTDAGRFLKCRPLSGLWGRSSVGRAPQWHCGGQGFESPRLHHFAGKRFPQIGPRPAAADTEERSCRRPLPPEVPRASVPLLRLDDPSFSAGLGDPPRPSRRPDRGR